MTVYIILEMDCNGNRPHLHHYIDLATALNDGRKILAENNNRNRLEHLEIEEAFAEFNRHHDWHLFWYEREV